MKSIHHVTLVFGLLLFSFLFIPTISHAENGDMYEVGEIILNVRSEPSNNAEIIGQLVKGDKVMAFQEKFGWVQTYYGGQEAWVAAHFLTKVSGHVQGNNSTSEAASEKITVTADSVNIRSGPGKNHSIIGSTASGDTYNLVETAGDWHKVTLADASTGWIAAWLTNTATKSETLTNERSTNESSESVEQKTTNKSLEGYNIVLDPGHGGKDPGAIGLGGVYEKDFVTSTASKVTQQLRDAGATVIMTRSGDYFVSLDKRVEISQEHNTHAFISLHYNAFPMIPINGVSTYYSNAVDRELAQEVHSSLASNISLHNRGVMHGDYRVLRYNEAPSILMELGFITNPDDLAVIQTDDYQNKVAQAIMNGLKNYFND